MQDRATMTYPHPSDEQWHIGRSVAVWHSAFVVRLHKVVSGARITNRRLVSAARTSVTI